MTEVKDMDFDVDKCIARTLKTAPKPRLSADFTATALERMERMDRRRDMFRRASKIQAIYWAIALVGTGFIISRIRWPGWISLVLLILTPFVFVGLASWRRFLPGIAILTDDRRKP